MKEEYREHLANLIDLIECQYENDTTGLLEEIVTYGFIHDLMITIYRLDCEIEVLKEKANRISPKGPPLPYPKTSSNAWVRVDPDHPVLLRYQQLYGSRAVEPSL
jgi:hypothetical protein